jgi:C4-dicarboxylate-specific signal transduction histidine kinase
LQSFLRTQPILRQVLATAAVLLALLAAVIVWSAFRTRDERADEVEAEAGTVARTAAALLNEYFASLDAMASTLAHDPEIRALEAAASTNTLRAVVAEQPLVGNITLRGRDGTLVASGVVFASPAPPPSEITLQALRTGRPAVSQLVLGPILQRRTLLFAYPVRGDRGGLVGVLTIGVELTRLEALFARLPLPEGSVVALADQQNLILARSVDSRKYIGSALEGTKGAGPTSFQTDADGVQRFHGSATVERGPWRLTVAIPRTEVLKRLAPVWRRNLSITGAALVCVISLTLWISWHTAFDLRRLQHAARRIASGDLSPPEKKPARNLEMDQLQSSFAIMAERLRDARDSLEQQFEQERKMREAVQTLQRQVVRQERLAAVGLLVSGIAHELNNPLQAIVGTVELMEREPGLPDSLIDSIAFAKTQSIRANDIIRSLARFSRHGSGNTAALVDVRDVIADVLQLRKRELDSLSISVDVDARSGRAVLASFAELEQVVLNFVINAQQAIEATGRRQGRIRIRLADTGKKVRLDVSDDGKGVRPEDEQKLFQPFFTTKPVGYGTGLGLSVSYGIIEAHGGVMGYMTNEWGGATFFFELPAAVDNHAQTSNDGAALLH